MIHKLSLYVVMIAVAALLQLGFGGDLSALFARRPLPADGPVVDIALGVAVGLLAVLLSRLGTARFDWSRRIDAEFRDLLGPLEPREIFGLAIASALAEEMFFRGFLQPLIGLEASAVVFGAAHVPWRRSLIAWTFAALAMGYVLGWMFEARGNLIAPVLAHFTVNYFNLHALVRPLAHEAP
ncbi:MAG: CPBP family intramembrane metalloprotease [Myxococcales bacterium]|nr:CPBP family intramembrane metalloprotease [Myxococcales bacterium]